jgi:drug/metabolite transporter (DMT)-like permease
MYGTSEKRRRCWQLLLERGLDFFTFSVRRLGVFHLNVVRVTAALVMIAAVMFIMTGSFYPKGAPAECWAWLAVSSIVGIVVGDMFYFAALKSLGPRYTMLLYSISPPVAAFCEWVLLKNAMSAYALLGMAVTLFGVGLAVTEKSGSAPASNDDGRKTGFGLKRTLNISSKGAALALAAAFCQGVGLVFSKWRRRQKPRSAAKERSSEC